MRSTGDSLRASNSADRAWAGRKAGSVLAGGMAFLARRRIGQDRPAHAVPSTGRPWRGSESYARWRSLCFCPAYPSREGMIIGVRGMDREAVHVRG